VTDQRSDIYSLGILLHELALGRLPFPMGAIADAFHYHRKEPPDLPPLHSLFYPNFPQSVEQVIVKTIQKNPDDRYANAAELAKALDGMKVDAATLTSTPTILADGKPVKAVSLTQFQSVPPPSLLTPLPDEMDRLQVLEKGKTGRLVNRKRGAMTIGRGPENDIPLSNPKVSHQHVNIESDRQSYSVQDHSSTHGTFLGGAKLLLHGPKKWNHDKNLQIGETWIRFIPAKVTVGRPEPVPEPPSVIKRKPAVTVEPESLPIEPGSWASLMVTILNRGSTVQHYVVSLRGIPSTWLEAQPPRVMLMDGDQQAVNLTNSPPRQPESRVLEMEICSSHTSEIDDQAEGLPQLTTLDRIALERLINAHKPTHTTYILELDG